MWAQRLPLTDVLGPSGRYVGLEPVEALRNWCREEISSRFPQFEFPSYDVFNALYNPCGELSPEDSPLPSQSKQFHLVFATSVFTHLQPAATRNYASEISRVLHTCGRFFATFFLIENGVVSADGILKFDHPLLDAAFTIDPDCPERAVAYRTDWLVKTFRSGGLTLIPPIRWGTWAGKPLTYSGQDVLIFEKRE